MEFKDLVKHRYSCKQYSDRKLEPEKLEAILEAGRWAPTAKNQQVQRIYVLQSEEALAIVDKVTPCRYGATTVLAVAYDINDVYTYLGDRYNSGAEDVTIVATHMMLAAANEGVDSCWLNRFNPDELAKELKLPENQRIVILMDLGYAAEGAGPLPNHHSRKPLSETVTYL
ncbi:MAG: nitroreductase family protein [Eubacteriales bacterium]|nr:nitroreductase family protein [Eubacteriales bacterium]